MNTTTKTLFRALGLAVVFSIGASQSLQAAFSLGGASSYGVLFNSTGNNTLTVNSSPLNPNTFKKDSVNGSTVSGDIGLGTLGSGTPKMALNNPGVIRGDIDFGGAVNYQNSSGKLYGSVNGNVSAVNSALNDLATLSSSMAAASGQQSLAINAGNNITQTINLNNYTLNGSGNIIFNVSSLNLQNGGTLIIDGSGLGNINNVGVVFNINFSTHFAGNIFLNGGLNSDQVLFNMLGNSTMQTAANGATITGTFLDMNGTIGVNSVIIQGRLFGGGGGNMSIVSGATLFAPTPVPEPTTVIAGLLVLLPLGVSSLRILRNRSKVSPESAV